MVAHGIVVVLHGMVDAPDGLVTVAASEGEELDLIWIVRGDSASTIIHHVGDESWALL